MVTGGNDSLLKVWKLWNKSKKSGQIENIKTLSGHGGNIMSVKFAKNGKIFVSTSGDKTLRIWHAANLNCLRVLEGILLFFFFFEEWYIFLKCFLVINIFCLKAIVVMSIVEPLIQLENFW